MKVLMVKYLVIFSIGYLISPAKAAPIEKISLDLAQGFDFSKSSQASFGYITELRVGSYNFTPDISVTNPVSKIKTKIVAPLAFYNWSTLQNDEMKFGFNVTAENRKKLAEVIARYKTSPKVDVELNFQIYSYNPNKKEYFLSMKTFTFPHRGVMNRVGYKMAENKLVSHPIKGYVRNINNQLQMSVEKSANTSVLVPVNYGGQLILAPPENLEQDLVAAEPTGILNKIYWGIQNFK